MHIEKERLDLEKVGKDKYELKLECINEERRIVEIMRRLRESSQSISQKAGCNESMQVAGPQGMRGDENRYGKSLENSPVVSSNLDKMLHHSGKFNSEANFNSQICSTISPLRARRDILPSDLLSQQIAVSENEQKWTNLQLLGKEEISQQTASSVYLTDQSTSLFEGDALLHNISVVSQCNQSDSIRLGGKPSPPTIPDGQLEDEFLSFQSQELLWNQSDLPCPDAEKIVPNSVGNSFPDLSQSTLMELDNAMDSYEKKPVRCNDFGELPVVSQENPFVENAFQIGFRTAAGNRVSIKAEALAAAQKLLCIRQDEPEIKSFNNTLNEKEPEIKSFNITSNEKEPHFSGFTTAAGNRVHINPDSLAKATSILAASKEIGQKNSSTNDESLANYTTNDEEIDHAFHQEVIHSIQHDFCGFSTAAGKKISVSKESIEVASKLIDDKVPIFSVHTDDKSERNGGNFDFACGFSTAAGAKVSISNKSIKKALSILEDEGQKVATHEHAWGKSSIDDRNIEVAKQSIDKESIEIAKQSVDLENIRTTKQSMDMENIRAARYLIDKENIDPNQLQHQSRFHSNDKPQVNSDKTQAKRGKFIETKKSLPPETIKTKSGIKNPQFIPPKLHPIKLQRVEIQIEKPKPKIAFDLSIFKKPMQSLKQFIRSKNENSVEKNNFTFPNCSLRMSSAESAPNVFHEGTSPSMLCSSIFDNQLASFSLMDFCTKFSQFFPNCASDWIKNHSTLLYWKYNSLQIKYPNIFDFSPNDIFSELLYRYQMEYLEGKRSIVKLIAEKDESPSLNMILVVYDIIYDEPLTLVLTDGWYFIRAKVDEPLSWLVMQKKIQVGLKLCIYGAQLESSSYEGISVLESFDKISLKIFANSTKPAGKFAKLGLCKQFCFAVSLNQVFPDGGIIPCLDVVVQRKYSLSYMKSGISITSNEYHRFCEKIQQSFYAAQTMNEERYRTDGLYEKDKEYCESEGLHNTNSKSIDDSYEKYQQELKTITCLFKFKIANYSNAIPNAAEATFTFWRPNEEIYEMIKEGGRIRIFNSRATSNYQGVPSICNTSNTMIEVKRAQDEILCKCFSARSIIVDFSRIKQGYECDIRVYVESNSAGNGQDLPQKTSRQEACGSKVLIRDSLMNFGILNISINPFMFDEATFYLIRNAYLNFYDQNSKTFIFSLSDQSTVEAIAD